MMLVNGKIKKENLNFVDPIVYPHFIFYKED